MDWTGLEDLGPKFLETVRRIYKQPRIFFFALAGEQDARDALGDVFGSIDSSPLGDEGVRLLLKWRDNMKRSCDQVLNLQCQCSFEHIKHPGLVAPKTLQEEFEEIVKEDPGYVLDLAKRRLKRKKESKGTHRADLE